MDVSQQPLLEFLNKFLKQSQARRKWSPQRVSSIKRGHIKNRKSGRILMKKRAFLDRSRRPVGPTGNQIQRKVRTLKKLIPNCESMGLDWLFRETADYIIALQMRVKVMQIMVNVFSGSDDQ
ncbi:transcription factor UPBEAT1 [Olea europaea subsp. europaea]|uniref:Transcription factor UPBEAT1 n=1 Tax=Olea europaea subsp. europaea TaxID=158383 RepID=A0A8S0P8A5_OLEEU|nr:transcription factor UPBEAT1 [Olea europaea subsp. europaea]